MDAMIPLGVLIVCLAGAVALGVLAYMLINLLKIIKETMFKVDPMLNNVNDILNDVAPVVKKIDPVIDRVTLTIDAANLEIMRVDQIMEDVSKITGNMSKAASNVDTITSAPLTAVGGLTKKIRDVITPIANGEPSDCPLSSQPAVTQAAAAVDSGLDALGSKIDDALASNEQKKVKAQASADERDAKQAAQNKAGSELKTAVYQQIGSDTVK